MVPAMSAITASMRTFEYQKNTHSEYLDFITKLETVLARPFSELSEEAKAINDSTVATKFSDPIGTRERKLIYLSHFDLDNLDNDSNVFTGGEDEVIWIQIKTDQGKSYQTLRYQHAPFYQAH